MVRGFQIGITVLGAFAVAVLAHCTIGEVNTYNQGCPDGCPTGQICIDGACVDESVLCQDVTCPAGERCQGGLCVEDDPCAGVTCDPGMFCVEGACVTDDPCAGVHCYPGQHCEGGACITDDPCEGVTCEEGQTCQGGWCVDEDRDNDHDGYAAATDCNDEDPTIHPGATEVCDAVDQNCNDMVDEGFDSDGDGFTTCGAGGANIDCRDDDASIHPLAGEDCDGRDNDCDDLIDEDLGVMPCSSACGDGEESCVDGEWVCDAPTNCECTPGEEDSEPCDLCGIRRRTCTGDATWGSWGACEGSGECSPGETQREDCERCGERSRTCGDDCRWGSWGSCQGMGQCDPGDTRDGDCDACSYQRCSSITCRWEPCEVRSGNECEWRSGRNYRCCDVGHWQFCLSSCVWSTDCAACSGCCHDG